MKLFKRIICFFRGHGRYEALSDGTKVWCGYCGTQVNTR